MGRGVFRLVHPPHSRFAMVICFVLMIGLDGASNRPFPCCPRELLEAHVLASVSLKHHPQQPVQSVCLHPRLQRRNAQRQGSPRPTNRHLADSRFPPAANPHLLEAASKETRNSNLIRQNAGFQGWCQRLHDGNDALRHRSSRRRDTRWTRAAKGAASGVAFRLSPHAAHATRKARKYAPEGGIQLDLTVDRECGNGTAVE